MSLTVPVMYWVGLPVELSCLPTAGTPSEDLLLTHFISRNPHLASGCSPRNFRSFIFWSVGGWSLHNKLPVDNWRVPLLWVNMNVWRNSKQCLLTSEPFSQIKWYADLERGGPQSKGWCSLLSRTFTCTSPPHSDASGGSFEQWNVCSATLKYIMEIPETDKCEKLRDHTFEMHEKNRE